MSKKQKRVSEEDLMEAEKHDSQAADVLKEYREIHARGGRPVAYKNSEYSVIDENEPLPPPTESTESPLR